MKKISIIVAMHNDEKCIARCLESIAKQNYKNYEVICVDDASTDRTYDMCAAYPNLQNKKIIKLETNQGLSVVRQTGLEAASGEYVCFVDADDEIAADYLDTLSKIVDEGSLDICVFRTKYVSGDTEKESTDHSDKYNSPKKIVPEMLEKEFSQISTVYHLSDSWDKIYSREFLVGTKVKFCMNKGINGSDALFNKMIILHCPKIRCIPNVLYIHYSNPNSMVTRPNKDLLQMAITSYEKLAEEAIKKKIDIQKDLANLFLSISRKDFLNKIHDKEKLMGAVERCRKYILNETKIYTMEKRIDFRIFCFLVLHWHMGLKIYLKLFNWVKK